MSPRKPRTAADATPLGDKLRLRAAGYAGTGNRERAEGLLDAATLVDQDVAALSGKALVEALRVMVRAELEEFVADVVAAVRSAETLPAPVDLPAPTLLPRQPRTMIVGELRRVRPPSARPPATRDLPLGEHRCLVAIAQHAPAPVSRTQLTALTGYKRSTRDKYLALLGQRGYVESSGEGLTASRSGEAALGPAFERLPTGRALLAHWLGELPEGERLLLELVAKFYPHPAARERLGETLGYKRSTRDKYLSQLERRKLVERTGAGHVLASSLLFDPPSAEVLAKVGRS